MSPDPLTLPTLQPTGRHEWSNHHRNYEQPIRELFDVWNPAAGRLIDRYNATTTAIQAKLGEALTQNVRVRAYGSGWSISQAPITDGWMLNTRPLDLFFVVSASSVHPDYRGTPAGLRFLQCGNSISRINSLLRQQGRSLRTTGASNGQTIAGALSTGTHGSAIDVGNISDYVVGLHIITSPDRHIWLERNSQPVLADSFAQRLGAEVVRDDELFDAALVSFGSFGVIHGVAIETDENFLLDVYRSKRPLDAGLRALISTLNFASYSLPKHPRRPFHFEVRINPHAISEGVFVTAMYREPFTPNYRPPAAGSHGPGDDVLAVIGSFTDAFPAAIPALSRLLDLAIRDVNGQRGTIGEIFTDTATPRKAAGCAIAVPLEMSEGTMDMILQIARDQTFPGLVALRYVPRAKAMLGFQRFPRTCVIDVDGAQSDRTETLYRRVWDALRAQNIPHAMHWGKIHPADPASIRAMYPNVLDRWLDLRRSHLDAAGLRMFSSPFTDARGLSA